MPKQMRLSVLRGQKPESDRIPDLHPGAEGRSGYVVPFAGSGSWTAHNGQGLVEQI